MHRYLGRWPYLTEVKTGRFMKKKSFAAMPTDTTILLIQNNSNRAEFSELFRKIITHCTPICCNINVMVQPACLLSCLNCEIKNVK